MRCVPLLLVLALAATGCQASSLAEDRAERRADDAAGPDLAGRVRFARPQRAERITLVSLPGEVVLPSAARRALAPPLPGRLQQWLVALGDRVEAGQPLARMHSPELTDLASRRRELRAVVEARGRLLHRLQEQVSAGLATAQELQSAQMALQEAEAALQAVEARIRARRALGAAGRSGGGWLWRAPAAGLVHRLDCPAGSMVGPEERCLQLVDPSLGELRVRVPERYLQALQCGPRARLWPSARPETSVELHLARRDGLLAPSSRTLAHYFVPPGGGAPGPWWLPGATGRVELHCEAPEGLLRLPRSAVTRLQGRDVVFVGPPEDPARAEPVAVHVAGRYEEELLVRLELPPGAQVAVAGVFLLKSLRLLGDEEAP